MNEPADARAVERLEDPRLLRGQGLFVGDLQLEGMLHAAILRSTAAHGRLRGLNVAAAQRLAGVHAILTAADFGPDVPTLPLRLAPIVGVERFMQVPIATDTVRYVGEPMAIVLADSRAIAEDALGLIEPVIEPLPAVADRWAAEAAATLVHATHNTNIAACYEVTKGNVDEMFAGADYVRCARFSSQRQTACPMETRGLVVAWDRASGRLTVYGAAKVPHTARQVLAVMMGMRADDIDMIELDIGGGFGVRGEVHPEDYLIPFAARAVGRPIKWIEDRQEHLCSANHSREMSCDLEIACRRDGEMLGIRAKLWADMGAWIRPNSAVVPAKAAQFLVGPYRIAHARMDVALLLTNKTPIGTYRGPGRVEANFFRERLIDMAAAELGLDPVEMRRRNLVTPAEMPYELGNLVPYESGAAFDTGDFPAALQRAADEIDYHRLRKIQGRLIDGRRQGVAVTACAESSGPGPREHARIRLTPEGRVQIFVGSSNLGQGLKTVFAQIAGAALALPIGVFDVVPGSTTHLKHGLGTYASRAVVMGGSAVHVTALKFKTELKRHMGDGRNVPWSEELLVELAAQAAASGERLDVEGVFENSRLTWTSGAHACHVAVDPSTGAVEVLDYVAVEDVGRAINPALVHGQAIGGIVQGLGGALLDHLVYDEEGQLLTGSLADYLLPTASDFPHVRAVTLEDCPSSSNPLGAKGAGEGPIVMVAATLANAVAAALQPLGVEITDLPLSPARVHAAIMASNSVDGQR